jgi:lipopolysaccharide/colanic/teichoic acid biosynthesis glycosyltransferase
MEGMDEYQKKLAIQRHRGYRMLGVITDGDSGPEESAGLPVLGGLERWEEIVSGLDVQLVVVREGPSATHGRRLVPTVVERCLQQGIEVEVYSDLFASSALNYELDEYSGLLRFYAATRWSLRLQRWLKVVLDRVVGLVGSVVTLLLVPVVGALIKWEDNGPIFYRREFVGCDGRIHFYLKFRTMRTDADEILRNDAALRTRFEERQKLENDPRILRVGRVLRKYSIDEFPEFFSLLRGDLALVGPRVISGDEKKRYGELLPKLLSVKPGITGFWQVMGRQTTSYAERIEMDMFYIDHWSIWLDLLIFAKTFWKLIRPEGAY